MWFLPLYSTTQILRTVTSWPKKNDISAYLLSLSKFLFQTLSNFPLKSHDHPSARRARTPLCVTWGLLLILSLTAVSAIECLSYLLWCTFSLSVSFPMDSYVFPFQWLFSRVRSPRIVKYFSWGSYLMPLMILLQCSYGTKEFELKNNLNTWLNLGFTLWKEKFSLLLSVFLVFCVLFDCYNTLNWDFRGVSVVSVKAWDTTISIIPIIFHVKFESVPRMRMMTFVHNKFLLLSHSPV